jgi:hypothetical protein
VDEARQKGTKREQCRPVLFSVCCVRPTTHSESQCSSTPDLSRHSAIAWPQFPRPYVKLTDGDIFVSLYSASLYMIYTTYECFTAFYLHDSRSPRRQTIYFAIVSEIFQVHREVMSAQSRDVTAKRGIIDYTKNRYRRIRGDHEFMRYYGSVANGFTYPLLRTPSELNLVTGYLPGN